MPELDHAYYLQVQEQERLRMAQLKAQGRRSDFAELPAEHVPYTNPTGQYSLVGAVEDTNVGS